MELVPEVVVMTEKGGGERLFHLLMGDLARFYMSQALDSLALQRRFWMTVDRLAACGDDAVQNAIGVSLIEWFAWGNDRERATLVAAKPLMSGLVRAISDEFLRNGGSWVAPVVVARGPVQAAAEAIRPGRCASGRG